MNSARGFHFNFQALNQRLRTVSKKRIQDRLWNMVELRSKWSNSYLSRIERSSTHPSNKGWSRCSSSTLFEKISAMKMAFGMPRKGWHPGLEIRVTKVTQMIENARVLCKFWIPLFIKLLVWGFCWILIDMKMAKDVEIGFWFQVATYLAILITLLWVSSTL